MFLKIIIIFLFLNVNYSKQAKADSAIMDSLAASCKGVNASSNILNDLIPISCSFKNDNVKKTSASSSLSTVMQQSASLIFEGQLQEKIETESLKDAVLSYIRFHETFIGDWNPRMIASKICKNCNEIDVKTIVNIAKDINKKSHTVNHKNNINMINQKLEKINKSLVVYGQSVGVKSGKIQTSLINTSSPDINEIAQRNHSQFFSVFSQESSDSVGSLILSPKFLNENKGIRSPTDLDEKISNGKTVYSPKLYKKIDENLYHLSIVAGHESFENVFDEIIEIRNKRLKDSRVHFSHGEILEGDQKVRSFRNNRDQDLAKLIKISPMTFGRVAAELSSQSSVLMGSTCRVLGDIQKGEDGRKLQDKIFFWASLGAGVGLAATGILSAAGVGIIAGTVTTGAIASAGITLGVVNAGYATATKLRTREERVRLESSVATGLGNNEQSFVDMSRSQDEDFMSDVGLIMTLALAPVQGKHISTIVKKLNPQLIKKSTLAIKSFRNKEEIKLVKGILKKSGDDYDFTLRLLSFSKDKGIDSELYKKLLLQINELPEEVLKDSMKRQTSINTILSTLYDDAAAAGAENVVRFQNMVKKMGAVMPDNFTIDKLGKPQILDFPTNSQIKIGFSDRIVVLDNKIYAEVLSQVPKEEYTNALEMFSILVKKFPKNTIEQNKKIVASIAGSCQ